MAKILNKEDFLARIVKAESGCWMWPGGSEAVYGSATFEGRGWGAHRLAMKLLRGEERDSAWYCCHHCDVRGCVNPDHLFWGTNSDNQKDSARKGRAGLQKTRVRPCGEVCARTVLTADQVREIRRLAAAGKVNYAELGRRYGIVKSGIRAVVTRVSWKHIE